MSKKKGTLIIIGGHEDREGDRVILKEVARRAKRREGPLVLLPIATELPRETIAEYRKTFADLGVKDFEVVDIRARDEAHDPKNVERIMRASVIFFTGGDQLRITSQIGDTPVYRCLMESYENGGVIVGTSAGAAVMSDTMMVGGTSGETNQVANLEMSPGLGLLRGVVIDSHFAERGRISRLLTAVAKNPKNLGVGIDEDTAIILHGDDPFQVIGSGGVYVVDGSTVSCSNVSEAQEAQVIAVCDVRLHLLGAGDAFDLPTRRPFSDGQPIPLLNLPPAPVSGPA